MIILETDVFMREIDKRIVLCASTQPDVYRLHTNDVMMQATLVITPSRAFSTRELTRHMRLDQILTRCWDTAKLTELSPEEIAGLLVQGRGLDAAG